MSNSTKATTTHIRTEPIKFGEEVTESTETFWIDEDDLTEALGLQVSPGHILHSVSLRHWSQDKRSVAMVRLNYKLRKVTVTNGTG